MTVVVAVVVAVAVVMGAPAPAATVGKGMSVVGALVVCIETAAGMARVNPGLKTGSSSLWRRASW